MRAVIFTLILMLVPKLVGAETVYEYLYKMNGVSLVYGLEKDLGIVVDSDTFLEEPVIREYLSHVTNLIMDDMPVEAYRGLQKKLNYQSYTMTWRERRAVYRWESGKSCYIDWEFSMFSWLATKDNRLQTFNDAVVNNLVQR